MYFTSRKKRKIAFAVFAAMMTGIFSGGFIGTTRYAIAAEGGSDAAEVSAPEGDGVQESPAPDSSGSEPTSLPTAEPAGVLQVTGLQMLDNTTDSITMAWLGSVTEGGSYYVYQYNMEEERYDFLGSSQEMFYTCSGLEPAKKYYFAVRVFDEKNGTQSEFSERLEAYTKPEKVKGLSLQHNTASEIKISWDAVEGADGYEVYCAEPNDTYVLAGIVNENVFTDSGLNSGKTYRYKVCAYSCAEENTGALSAALKTTTLPAKPVVKVKGGEKKARITWAAVTGASGYYLYCYDGEEFQYLSTLVGKGSTSYIHQNLENGKYSKYKVEAYRILNGTEYKSTISDEKKAMVAKQKSTVTSPRLFKNKEGFKNSAAYKKCEDFKKKVNYAKTYVIPGISGTNVDGFYSSNMCPQGLTFAKSYMLLSAYDRKQEENSVLYVLDKTGKKLILTVALPNKTHAGGIAYDGYNIWVTQSKKVHAIPFAEIERAVSENAKTLQVAFQYTSELTHAASTLTYYKNKLWVGSYDELKSGYLGAYTIKDKKGKPTLSQYALTRIPTRVQGIAFTDNGKLILSRSCQTDSSKRGFLHVLDVYKPDLSKLSDGAITLGKLLKTWDMPTMNEEIAVSGNYLYVSFESAAFSTAVKRMDRVCAFKTKSITE